MNWFVDTKTEHAVTKAVVRGQLNANDYLEMRKHVRAQQIEQAGESVLLDLRQATLQFGTLDVFAIGLTHHEVFPRGTPYAILMGPDTMNMVDARFLENLKFNRGSVAKVFTDEVAAEEWLLTDLEDPSS